ncbi:hypothetical protein RM572_26420 [Streptomyces sp. DSM 42041]|uniref:LPXTG cell wall anchor domain-containing protein n=1 Tax=Streptomyces hazeniae TaxID=3075538 RepID=A0ABU2P1I1_9ACTN|nr:hypothetical protein [Streptomyces sp. DSM 42041]MDT0382298.1 hypothetical protein [Streptomyces sp. DSM 42041]
MCVRPARLLINAVATAVALLAGAPTAQAQPHGSPPDTKLSAEEAFSATQSAEARPDGSSWLHGAAGLLLAGGIGALFVLRPPDAAQHHDDTHSG